MKVGIDPRLASNMYKNVAAPQKEKDGQFTDMVKDLLGGVVEQSKITEQTTMSQSKNSSSSGDFAAMSLNIKDLDVNLKAIMAMRDNIVDTVNKLQQMPM